LSPWSPLRLESFVGLPTLGCHVAESSGRALVELVDAALANNLEAMKKALKATLPENGEIVVRDANPVVVRVKKVASRKRVATKTQGRPERSFSQLEMGRILRMLRDGIGRLSVCETMEVSYKTFQKIMRDDESFGQWVRQAEASRVQKCEADLFRMATRGYDSPVILRAILAYLGRCDRIQENRRGRAEKARLAKQAGDRQ
jgi:hypothetical protein